MPAATAPKKSTARKSSAKSSTKRTPEKKSPEAQAIEELRDKRAEFDQPIVDTPVAVTEGGETQSKDEKDTIEIVPVGAAVQVTLGSKTVTLDREGVLSLQRHLDKVAAGV